LRINVQREISCEVTYVLRSFLCLLSGITRAKL
jgi:hypothetical protein